MPRQYGYPRGTFIGADEDTMGDDEGSDSPFQFTQYAKRRQTPGFRQGARDPKARSRYTGMRPRQQEVQSVAPPEVSVATGPTQTEIDALIKKYRSDMKEANVVAQKAQRDIAPDTIGAPTGMSTAQSGAQGIVGSPFGMGTAADLAINAATLSNMGVTGANIGIGATLLGIPTGVIAAVQHGRQVAALQGQVSEEALSDPVATSGFSQDDPTPVSVMSSEQQAHVMDIAKGTQQAQAVTGIKGTIGSIAKGLQLDDLAEMLGITRGKGATSVTADDLATQESPLSLVADPITRGFSSLETAESAELQAMMDQMAQAQATQEALSDLEASNMSLMGPSSGGGRAEANVIGAGDGLGEGPSGQGIGDSSW